MKIDDIVLFEGKKYRIMNYNLHYDTYDLNDGGTELRFNISPKRIQKVTP